MLSKGGTPFLAPSAMYGASSAEIVVGQERGAGHPPSRWQPGRDSYRFFRQHDQRVASSGHVRCAALVLRCDVGAGTERAAWTASFWIVRAAA